MNTMEQQIPHGPSNQGNAAAPRAGDQQLKQLWGHTG
jgi:hypothetical protein